MKQKFLAGVIAACFVAPVAAQSSVTLYGIVDVGLQWNEFGVNFGTSSAPNFRQEDTWGINSGYQSGSRFGLRGSESLFGAWSAVYTLEGGYDVDTGQSGQSGRLFGRQAWAGLQHREFGTVALGRIATPSSTTGSFDLWSGVDPFGGAWGINGIQSTFVASNSTRWDNSVIWASPTWAGFKLAAQYTFNTDGQETAPSGTNTSGYALGANWTWGFVFLAANYTVYDFADAGGSRAGAGNPDEKLLQLGAALDFKFVKLHAAYASQDNISTFQVANFPGWPVSVAPYDNSAYMVGVTVPLLGGNIRASYQYSDADTITTATYSFEPDYSVWGIGFDYPFSRRTNLYVGYGQREWDGALTSTPVQANPSARVDRAQFALGLRHLF
jgi:general bacterial porin, GBP family